MHSKTDSRVETDIADVLVIGGGPAGACAAMRAARNGLRVTVFEQARHPRFHVGESFLPRNLGLIRELGLEDGLKRIPQTLKLGATFVMGNEREPTDIHFEDGLLPHDPAAFNIERAPFDALVSDAAREAGAEIVENATVRGISSLQDGEVVLDVRDADGKDRTCRGRILLDASGQSTVVGRHLGHRRTLPELKKVAYFGHFRNVFREEGVRAGFPVIVLCREGWFWMIPIDGERTSIGLVMDAEQAKGVGVPAKEMLAWGIARCPQMRQRTCDAEFPESNGVAADFSYTCKPYAGPGYFLVGDAATFVDPIFSTGVCLGMMSGILAADGAAEILAGKAPEGVRRRYRRSVDGSSGVFFRLVRRFYSQSFREIFLQEGSPVQVRPAIISILCGHVFPRPPFSCRWRMRLFEIMGSLQRFVPLVPGGAPSSP